MNAIVSGRSGRALILEGDSLRSFDLDDPSRTVPRRRSDLPYLFGEAADLRIIEDTTIESVECELRKDCNFTWALDLLLSRSIQNLKMTFEKKRSNNWNTSLQTIQL
jgi:hypothetical protein